MACVQRRNASFFRIPTCFSHRESAYPASSNTLPTRLLRDPRTCPTPIRRERGCRQLTCPKTFPPLRQRSTFARPIWQSTLPIRHAPSKRLISPFAAFPWPTRTRQPATDARAYKKRRNPKAAALEHRTGGMFATPLVRPRTLPRQGTSHRSRRRYRNRPSAERS